MIYVVARDWYEFDYVNEDPRMTTERPDLCDCSCHTDGCTLHAVACCSTCGTCGQERVVNEVSHVRYCSLSLDQVKQQALGLREHLAVILSGDRERASWTARQLYGELDPVDRPYYPVFREYVLPELVRVGYLACDKDGRYSRATKSPVSGNGAA
jgi:hypothetical protein